MEVMELAAELGKKITSGNATLAELAKSKLN